MADYPEAHLIEFPKIGDSTIGYISFAECQKQVPFEIKRIFWTYFTPESVERGRHAHHATEQVLLAVTGRIIVKIENRSGNVKTFILDTPNTGLYIPPYTWHTMQYSHTAIQLVMASTPYNESDYIRDYNDFISI